jgi:phospholipase D-like protein
VDHLGTILTVALTLYGLGMCLFLISENRRPQATLAWMLAFFFAPGIGALLYIRRDGLPSPIKEFHHCRTVRSCQPPLHTPPHSLHGMLQPTMGGGCRAGPRARPCISASRREAKTNSRIRCSRPCVSRSADIWNAPRADNHQGGDQRHGSDDPSGSACDGWGRESDHAVRFLQQNQRVCPHDRRRDVVTAPRDLTTIPSLPTDRPHGIEPS